MNSYERFELKLEKEDADHVRKLAKAAKVDPSETLKALVEEALKSSTITDKVKKRFEALWKATRG